jgi:phage I-like protein
MAFKSKTKQQQPGIGIAVCSLALNAAGELQLTPAGKFRGIDGRPNDAEAWYIDAALAAKVIAFNSSRNIDLVIDYEHQTLNKEKNGQPAPAAGWFGGADLVWREGEGLFAKADLTQRAQDHIAAKEYKYLSPVFYYKKGTGEILGLHSAALTNTPNIDGMHELAIAAASAELDQLTNQQESNMEIKELLERIRYLLNLPALATPEEIANELQKAVDLVRGGPAAEVAANTLGVVGLVQAQGAQIAALSAATPDLSKFAPVEAMQALQAELAALTAANNEREVDGVVTAALSAGKLLPPQEKWARDLGKANMAALSAYLESAPQIDALTSTQTKGIKPEGQAEGELREAQLAMCAATGVSPEAFKKTLAAQSQT